MLVFRGVVVTKPLRTWRKFWTGVQFTSPGNIGQRLSLSPPRPPQESWIFFRSTNQANYQYIGWHWVYWVVTTSRPLHNFARLANVDRTYLTFFFIFLFKIWRKLFHLPASSCLQSFLFPMIFTESHPGGLFFVSFPGDANRARDR